MSFEMKLYRFIVQVSSDMELQIDLIVLLKDSHSSLTLRKTWVIIFIAQVSQETELESVESYLEDGLEKAFHHLHWGRLHIPC